MRAFLLIMLLTHLAGAAMAQNYGYPTTNHAYDPSTGNSYTTQRMPGGSSQTNGFNAQTGSIWNQRTDLTGHTTGMDARGNMYSVSPNGTYMNYGTGRTCVGQGAARVCN